MGAPDALDRTHAEPSRLRHRGSGPVGRLTRRVAKRQGDHALRRLGAQRLDFRGTRLVTNQAVEFVLHKAFLPAPNAGLGLGLFAGMIPFVPTPSAVNSTISARQTCFCGALRSCTTALSRRISADETERDFPARIAHSACRARIGNPSQDSGNGARFDPLTGAFNANQIVVGRLRASEPGGYVCAASNPCKPASADYLGQITFQVPWETGSVTGGAGVYTLITPPPSAYQNRNLSAVESYGVLMVSGSQNFGTLAPGQHIHGISSTVSAMTFAEGCIANCGSRRARSGLSTICRRSRPNLCTSLPLRW